MKNNSGFIAAEFLFAFSMIIGCGILIFALTFTLTTIEIAQYITWSAARSYAAGNLSEADSNKAATTKYKNLTGMFPLLTGQGNSSPWFEMSLKPITGALVEAQVSPSSSRDNKDSGQQVRQSWDGVAADIDLKLFKGLQIPFLGKIVANPEDLVFQVRSHLMRHPSEEECFSFFKDKYQKGILQLKTPKDLSSGGGQPEWNGLNQATSVVLIEDNGC